MRTPGEKQTMKASHAAQLADARAESHRRAKAAPRCGARSRSTGEPCKRPAMANGRCANHGGLVPKGDQWHVVQLTNGSGSAEKLNRKLRDLARRRAKQQKRLAAMSPERRAKYDAWHAARPLGGGAQRERARQERRNAQFLRELLEPPAPSSAVDQHEAEIRRLRAQLAVIEATTRGEGIFG